MKLLRRWYDGTLTFFKILLHSHEPWPSRLAMTTHNLFRRAYHRKDCCGHYGEPGC